MRIALRAALLFAVVGWVIDLAGRLGVALYPQQFLAAVVGISGAIVLLEPREGASRWFRAVSWVLGVILLALSAYVTVAYPDLQLALIVPPTEAVILGIVSIITILEATRRQTGPFLPILVVVMIGFVFLGPMLPAEFQTRPVRFSELILYLNLDTNALFGKVTDIAASVVIPFIVFGALLSALGGSAFFSDLAAVLVGRFRGGPAKVSVVGSGAFGMVSGSAVANVVAVGSVSIPMMARAGYARHVAAAIEAVASTGGQLMPPIMGASAFLMAEFLELPYTTIAIAAILPALFFYTAIFLAVDFEAGRLNMARQREAFGSLRRLRGARFLIPVGALIYLLFIEKRTPEYAGLLSIAVMIATYLVAPPREIWGRFKHTVRALLEAMAQATDIVMLAAAAGFIIGILSKTGAAFALTLQMLAVSGGSLPLLMALTAVVCIILGLGMPTAAVYILLATLVAPALVKLGVESLAAHFYVLYFGMLSMITPPIAIASFAAASVARTSPWRTAFATLRTGAGVYLVPVAVILQPELLFIGTWSETVVAMARLFAGVGVATAVSVGFVGRTVTVPLRLIGSVLAVACVVPLSGGTQDWWLWGAFAASLAFLAWTARPDRSRSDAAVAERPAE